MVVLEIAPSLLALLIGVAELVILAVFRSSLRTAFAAHRRWTLHREGRLHLSTALTQKDRFDMRITMVSALLFIVTMANLSIDGYKMRSTSRRIDTKCFAPPHHSRYGAGFGPTPDQLEDRRFDEYLNQANCTETLLAQALGGFEALETGYPHCAPDFTPPEDRVFETEFRGCGIGHVLYSAYGDLHCDVLPPNSPIESTVTGTNFFAVFEGGRQSSSTFRFDSPSQYIVTNSRIPTRWRPNGSMKKAVVRCTKGMDPLECYKLSREKVAEEKKARVSSESELGLYIQVLPNGESTICIFEDGISSFSEWVTVDQFFPDVAERNRRTGPVLTGFRVWGKARCIENLDEATARMHYDALENAGIMPNVTHKKSLIPWLQKHVVAMGVNMATEAAVQCKVSEIREGSLLGKAWIITILSTFLIFFSIVCMIYSCHARFRCPVQVDPLTSQWGIQELLKRKRRSRNREPEDCTEVYVGIIGSGGTARYELYENPDLPNTRDSNMSGS